MNILSVDLQNDFASEGGGHYNPRSCVSFIRDTFIPFVRSSGCTISEIISDYRVTGSPDAPSVCMPGKWGYQSIIPEDVKHPRVWVKAAPSPAWVRDGGGQADKIPGKAYLAPDDFTEWLIGMFGPPSPQNEIVVIGLVFEVCVLSTIQELYYRGYRARVLFEGVDLSSGRVEDKQLLFNTFFPFWGQGVYWHDLCSQL